MQTDYFHSSRRFQVGSWAWSRFRGGGWSGGLRSRSLPCRLYPCRLGRGSGPAPLPEAEALFSPSPAYWQQSYNLVTLTPMEPEQQHHASINWAVPRLGLGMRLTQDALFVLCQARLKPSRKQRHFPQCGCPTVLAHVQGVAIPTVASSPEELCAVRVTNPIRIKGQSCRTSTKCGSRSSGRD